MNLLFALRAARGWVDRDDLRRAIVDYRDLSDDAFDRQFSRDKDALRELGIEISTTDWDDIHEPGRSAYGYRITDEDYALPEIDLTPEEAWVLSIAQNFWQGTALGRDAQNALHKLRGLGHDLAPTPEPGVPQGVFATPAFSEALAQVRARRTVTFTYRKPGAAPEQRRVQPYGVHSRADRAYLVGYDLDRADVRNFRLSRIEGGFSRLRGTRDGDYEVPAGFDARSVFPGTGTAAGEGGTTEGEDLTTVTLAIAPGRADPLRREGTAAGTDALGRDLVTLRVWAVDGLPARLAVFGPSVEVLAPAHVREAHRAHLGAVRDRLAALGGDSPAPNEQESDRRGR